MHFIPFTRLQESQSIAGAKDGWLAATSELVEDMQWLLSLPHHWFVALFFKVFVPLVKSVMYLF